MTTLSRVQRNDPSLRELELCNTVHFTHEGMGCYWTIDSADLARLGDAIGANTNVRELVFYSTDELVDMAANNGAFFEGLKSNTSINNMFLVNCDIFWGMGRDILNGFVANNSSLTGIGLRQCTLENGGAGVLITQSSCPNLNWIRLTSCNIDDDILVQFVSGIKRPRQLRTLDLQRNNIGRAGCEALATILKDPMAI